MWDQIIHSFNEREAVTQDIIKHPRQQMGLSENAEQSDIKLIWIEN